MVPPKEVDLQLLEAAYRELQDTPCVARIFGISIKTVLKLLRQRQVPIRKIGRRNVQEVLIMRPPDLRLVDPIVEVLTMGRMSTREIARELRALLDPKPSLPAVEKALYFMECEGTLLWLKHAKRWALNPERDKRMKTHGRKRVAATA